MMSTRRNRGTSLFPFCFSSKLNRNVMQNRHSRGTSPRPTLGVYYPRQGTSHQLDATARKLSNTHTTCKILSRRPEDQPHHRRACNNNSDNNQNVRTFDTATQCVAGLGPATSTHKQQLKTSTQPIPHSHMIFTCRQKCTPTCISIMWSQLYCPVYHGLNSTTQLIASQDINHLSPSTTDNINSACIRLDATTQFAETRW